MNPRRPPRCSCTPARALAPRVVLSCILSHSAGAPVPSLWWPSAHYSCHPHLWTGRPGVPVPASLHGCISPGQSRAQGPARPSQAAHGPVRLHLDLISGGASESRGLPLSSPEQSPDGRETAGTCSAPCGAGRCPGVLLVESAMVPGGRESWPGIPLPPASRPSRAPRGGGDDGGDDEVDDGVRHGTSPGSKTHAAETVTS